MWCCRGYALISDVTSGRAGALDGEARVPRRVHRGRRGGDAALARDRQEVTRRSLRRQRAVKDAAIASTPTDTPPSRRRRQGRRHRVDAVRVVAIASTPSQQRRRRRRHHWGTLTKPSSPFENSEHRAELCGEGNFSGRKGAFSTAHVGVGAEGASFASRKGGSQLTAPRNLYPEFLMAFVASSNDLLLVDTVHGNGWKVTGPKHCCLCQVCVCVCVMDRACFALEASFSFC